MVASRKNIDHSIIAHARERREGADLHTYSTERKDPRHQSTTQRGWKEKRISLFPFFLSTMPERCERREGSDFKTEEQDEEAHSGTKVEKGIGQKIYCYENIHRAKMLLLRSRS